MSERLSCHQVPTKCDFEQLELTGSITEAGGGKPFFVSRPTVGGLMEATRYFPLAASSLICLRAAELRAQGLSNRVKLTLCLA